MLELSGTLAKIQTKPDDEFAFVWVKIASLTFPKVKLSVDIETIPGPVLVIAAPESASIVHAFQHTSIEIGDVISKALVPVPQPKPTFTRNDSPSAWSDLVAYLRVAGFSFYVQTREAAIANAEREYRDWTNGEILPDAAIYCHEGSIAHTWRLRFTPTTDMRLPFDVVPMGTVGRSFAKRPASGLRRDNGQIDVNFAEIAEQLVRAGLRVTAPGGREL